MFFLERKNQRTLSYSNLEAGSHDVVEDSVVKWAGLCATLDIPFNLDEVSVEDVFGIRLCGDLIRTSPVPEICTSLRSTTNYGKMGLFGKCEARGSHSLHGVLEAALLPRLLCARGAVSEAD